MTQDRLNRLRQRVVLAASAVMAATGLLAASPDAARATLIGDRVDLTLELLQRTFVDSLTVIETHPEILCVDGSGTSLYCGNNGGPLVALGRQLLNIEAHAISFQVTTALLPGIVTFSSLDWVGAPGAGITGISAVSNVDGFDPASVTFGAHHVTVDLVDFVAPATVHGLAISAENPATLSIDLATSHPLATPEPATGVLLGVGLAGLLGYGMRKRLHLDKRL